MAVLKVICDQCGREISKSNFSKHLRGHANHPEKYIKVSYKLNHDGLTCQFCGKICGSRGGLHTHERLCKSNPTAESPIRVGFNNKGRIAWNRGLTKQTDTRVLKGCITFKQNEIDNKHTNKLFGELNPSKRPEVRAKISQTCLEKSKNGLWHKSLAKDMHYTYANIDLDGTWEFRYAKYLDDQKIKWIRCKEQFEYTYNGNLHYYTPDFYLPDINTYIEVKGYKTEKDQAKWKSFPEDKKLIVLQEADLKLLGVL